MRNAGLIENSTNWLGLAAATAVNDNDDENDNDALIVGRDSITHLIATLSVRLGIAPQAILELDEVMLKSLIKVLQDDAKEMKNASNSKRRR